MNATLIVLRIRQPRRKRPFRVPLSIGGVPILPALGLAATLGLATQFDAAVYAGGVGAVLAGLALHLTRGSWGGGASLDGDR